MTHRCSFPLSNQQKLLNEVSVCLSTRRKWRCSAPCSTSSTRKSTWCPQTPRAYKKLEASSRSNQCIQAISQSRSHRVSVVLSSFSLASLENRLLVKKHPTKNYSQLVQYIIARVDFDLTADLSPKANADALNVNASYLSPLFKKETVTTSANYVNRVRIEQTIYLLNFTELPISTVGQRFGIQDDSYFTKIFKKCTAITPKQYLQQNSHFRKVRGS